MSVDGNWNITMSTPMGERKATLSLQSSGTALTGTQAAEAGSADLKEGKIEGDQISWSVSITNPMPLKLDFSGTVHGDAMEGQMRVGFMGSFPFTATRV